MSICGLASHLRVTPNFRIEKARALAKLNQAKDKLQERPNCQYIISRLQAEYDQLVTNMGDYYEMKKQLLENKKQKLTKKYELSVAKLECQQMKRRLQEQKMRWNELVAQYA
ncbi:fatty acid desaturase [Vibrio astriarenae]|nr:fatty acid desaturase [Vibrio sp. C7]